uniref:mitogen-activated protein kinase kinase kinase 20-like n=1 Tax=Erigeron canadensis TaxID=72917 RepID=UPI001CB8DE68|nr:mitogen-activated protein kinase kinase kinase 20-like [Erigeron canadensis]
MKKRSLMDKINEECKRSKQQQQVIQKKMYGDGVAWLRGALIGKGSFGSVFMAKLKNTNANYTYSFYPSIMAVKSAEYSVSGSIQKEKQVLDNIRGCPNVINCFGEEITTSVDGQMVYNLLMEYGSGGTLAGLIKKTNGKGLVEYDVRRYTRSIVRGLSHIHKKGYVHCDLKPDNVLLVQSFGRCGGLIAKIADLGLAKRAKQTVKKISSGPCWRGTPRYLSPEAVIQGVQEQPADIWAVGCIVLEMLTGKPIWCSNQDLGMDDVLSRISDYNGLPYVSSSISKEGRSFLKCCLSKRVMTRLTANMLLKHPFLKGLPDDDVDEFEESQQEVFDINTITSTSSSFDDSDDAYESFPSSWSDGSSYGLSSSRFHEVQEFPVSLAVCKGV